MLRTDLEFVGGKGLPPYWLIHRSEAPAPLPLVKPFMVRQAHHERLKLMALKPGLWVPDAVGRQPFDDVCVTSVII